MTAEGVFKAEDEKSREKCEKSRTVKMEITVELVEKFRSFDA